MPEDAPQPHTSIFPRPLPVSSATLVLLLVSRAIRPADLEENHASPGAMGFLAAHTSFCRSQKGKSQAGLRSELSALSSVTVVVSRPPGLAGLSIRQGGPESRGEHLRAAKA